jgi:hypothetical protein
MCCSKQCVSDTYKILGFDSTAADSIEFADSLRVELGQVIHNKNGCISPMLEVFILSKFNPKSGLSDL